MSVKVVIAEDSSFQRKIISEMLSEHKNINVVDAARNGEEALEMVDKYQPDVIILDLLMPKMDGLTTFKYIMEKNPTPTIIFSALDPQTLDSSVQALLMGAFDYIVKPSGEWKIEFPKFKHELISKVLMAAKSQIKSLHKKAKILTRPKVKKVKLIPKIKSAQFDPVSSLKPIMISSVDTNVIVMGASVGGPKTLKTVLNRIPNDLNSPILIVQHLNPEFIEQFVDSMGRECKISIKPAVEGEIIHPSQVYVAPGNKHMKIAVKNNKPCIKLIEGEPVNFCIPSIDVLFFSAAQVYKDHTMGVLLTGMGEDGVAGLAAIQKFGGVTITESLETCILYGMPKIAAERGVADYILPNYDIPEQIQLFTEKF